MSSNLNVLVAVAAAVFCVSYAQLQRTFLHDLKYSYSSTDDWASVYYFCNGSNQSPIAINGCENTALPPLTFTGHWDLRPSGFLLYNTGHSVEVQYNGMSPSISGGPLNSDYTLSQIHFHWGVTDEGSEHHMDGAFHGMEAHLVHYKTEYGSFEAALAFPDGLTVVAIMFTASDSDNSELDVIVGSLADVRVTGSTVPLGMNAMRWLESHLAVPGAYYTYHGSLTTPTCDEVVTWIILTSFSDVGRQQLAQFRSLEGHEGAILENRRELQPLNGRTVLCAS